jgi:hypothetical protein
LDLLLLLDSLLVPTYRINLPQSAWQLFSLAALMKKTR